MIVTETLHVVELPEYTEDWYFAGHHHTHYPGARCDIPFSALEDFLKFLRKKLKEKKSSFESFEYIQKIYVKPSRTLIEFDLKDGSIEEGENMSIHVMLSYKGNSDSSHSKAKDISRACADILKDTWASFQTKE